MLNLSKPAKIALIALCMGTFVAAAYMYFFDGLDQVSLQELPILYWVMLFFTPVLTLIMVVVGHNEPHGHTAPSTASSYSLLLVLQLFTGGLFLLLALLNNLMQPANGGNTAIFLAAGSQSLVTVYAAYRRHRVLNRF
jgi:hypothetical protein